jgi:hydroxymethylbilane synthase
MNKVLRIGTRDSELAIYQAKEVQKLLKNLGKNSVLKLIKSTGDKNLIQPIYEMGIQGVFTKALDTSLINNKIDVAVHSLKDIPTQIPKQLSITAILKRDSPFDTLVYSKKIKLLSNKSIIGTGSLRRKAQWLRKYPNHKTEDLRGNINTRIKKLNNSFWDGAIFSLAGIDRLKIKNIDYKILDWMIPSPGQGTIAICSRRKELELTKLLNNLNCKKTKLCIKIERNFINILEGGCKAPIGAYAKIVQNNVIFKSGLFSLDGSTAILNEQTLDINKSNNCGIIAANEILKKGGEKLINKIQNELRE